MNMPNIKPVRMLIGILSLISFSVSAQTSSSLHLVNADAPEAFPLVQQNKAATLYIDAADAEVVNIAATALQSDIKLVTGSEAKISNSEPKSGSFPVIIGTAGKSATIDKLLKDNKIPAFKPENQWESFSISVVNNPLKGVEKALVIVGSDRRGTAFGVFELSGIIGVSPFVWWADVTPKHRDNLYIVGTSTVGSPSVKYRGIFLNDEDWGLKPWAAKNVDTDIADIGPKTYAHIFELLLRLKANFIWPAMHVCTKAFYYYPENPKTADKYAIVVGSSHCEPVLRNNVFEWTLNFENEYGTKPGPWRYDTNKDKIYKYWDDRARQSASYESVYTVGMRGVHDSGMPGGKTFDDKLSLLGQVIDDQRTILSNNLKKPASDIPQLFCPYKEVLKLYQGGLKLADDVTIVWADDNHGYIRQLSTDAEQKRSGASGIYYHFSYWGSPYDYQWLSTVSPSLTAYEMHKAYAYGANRLWVFNVGDLKPAEKEIEFAMEMAWDINKWTPQNAHKFPEYWAAKTFGAEFAPAIGAIMSEYYRLAQCGKPEHLGVLNFTNAEMDARLESYRAMLSKTDELAKKIPVELKDAYFELVQYPVSGAALMNEKFFNARKSLELAPAGKSEALEFAQEAESAFEQIQNLTIRYNTTIAKGKWNGIMSYRPRNLAVFKMPQVATPEMLTSFNPSQLRPDSNSFVNGRYDTDLIEERVPASPQAKVSIPAASFRQSFPKSGQTIETLQGLGLDGNGISLFPYTEPSVADSHAAQAPYVEYSVSLAPGQHTISVKALPTHSISQNRGVRYGIAVNNDNIQVVNLYSEAGLPVWKHNVLRGYSLGTTTHTISPGENTIIRIYLLDPGVVLNRIDVN